MSTKDNPLSGWAGLLPMLSMGAMVGAMPRLMGMLKENETMTQMERAFTNLLKLVLQKLEDQDAELSKLRLRPTVEEMKETRDELERLGNLLDGRQRRCEELEKQLAKRGKKS